ncbi:MAG: putative DNA binding domain-containing protein [Oscillospiraceae bacterium]|nr:putative DNA binding domain-containing protein [Oscillospiraceae bacterium]
MLESELVELVNKITQTKSESNSLEIKAARDGCPKLFETLSSFSNQYGGGIIVFGVDEKNGFEICGVYDPADLQKKIMEQAFQMEPELRPLCTVAIINGNTVVSAEIQEIDNELKPCFYKGVGRLKGSFVRVGDGDKHMTEYEVYSFEAFRKKIQDELRIAKRAEISDIDTDAHTEYLITMHKKKPNLAGLSTDKINSLQGFTCNGKPTLAGVMLFSPYPQGFFPQLCVTAVSIQGTEMGSDNEVGERFIDNARIDGNIVNMLEESLKFVRKNMKTATYIDPQTGKRADKTEYPVIAVRELILNALIHRDYSTHTESTPITIKMFANRIEIENPGGLYGRMTLDRLGKVAADTRNPFLANALEVIDVTENRYSGIPTVCNAMKNAGLPEPKFENERGVFRVTLYNSLDTTPLITNNEADLLMFCQTPRTRAEIEQHFRGRLSINYLMTHIVHQLVNSGKLKLTIPDKPKSKNQRYYS